MHEVLVNCLGGLNLPRKSVVRLTDRPDMTLGVYRGRIKTIQYNKFIYPVIFVVSMCLKFVNARPFHQGSTSSFSGLRSYN